MREVYLPLVQKLVRKDPCLVFGPWYKAHGAWDNLRKRDIKNKRDLTYPKLHEELWNIIHEEIERVTRRGHSEKAESPYSARFPYESYDLGYGKVDLYFEVDKNAKKEHEKEFKCSMDLESFVRNSYQNIGLHIVCRTEYPNIVYGQLCKYFPPTMMEIDYSQRGYSTLKPIKPVVIIPTKTTEISLKLGLSDLVFDCVASGKSLHETDSETIGRKVLTSTARLYAVKPHPLRRLDVIANCFDKDIRGFLRREYTIKEEAENELIIWKQEKIREVAKRLQDAARKLEWVK